MIKPSAKSVAERKAKSRATQEKKSNPTGAEGQARRRSGRTNTIDTKSKHLKGQLDPPVGNITFLDHQGGQLDPPVLVLRFWIIKVISWIPRSVTLRFWITN